jgi:hypothetical protein
MIQHANGKDVPCCCCVASCRLLDGPVHCYDGALCTGEVQHGVHVQPRNCLFTSDLGRGVIYMYTCPPTL